MGILGDMFYLPPTMPLQTLDVFLRPMHRYVLGHTVCTTPIRQYLDFYAAEANVYAHLRVLVQILLLFLRAHFRQPLRMGVRGVVH